MGSTDNGSSAETEALLASLMAPDLPVGQVVRNELVECLPETPLCEAAQRMSAARCSSIIVRDGGKPVGIWTERDALKLDFSDPAVFLRPVGEVMSTPVLTIPADKSLGEVSAKFREARLRHFLVVDGAGQPQGVVSQTDVVLHHGIEHYLRLRKVSAVIKARACSVEAGASIAAAARLMNESAVDAVVVRYGGGEYGILTERDIVRLIGERRSTEPVGELASRPLVTVDKETTLYRVRRLLIDSRLRHVGVVGGDGGLLDLVSFSDILSGMELAYVRELQNALQERDDALRSSRRHLHLAEQVIENSLEGIMITDAKGIIQSVNPAFSQVTGYREGEVIGKSPAILSSGRHDAEFYRTMWGELREHGHWQGEVWNRRKNGEIYPELLTIAAIADDAANVTHYAALFSDITRLKKNEEQIKSLAYYDPLTGLPNRRLFEDRLQVAVAHAHRNMRQLAVLFVDLDRFKRINDSLGHSEGDQVLKEVALRLEACVREDDTVARMGGDEFVIILSEIEGPENATATARRVIEALTRPVAVGGKELVVTSSIGISIYPDDGDSAETLVRNSDIAMYRAKDTGRNSYQLYAAAMNARALEYLTLEAGLRRAVENDEFRVYLQPMFDAASGDLCAAEALLRWEHPDLGLVSPVDFIPLAEETGIIIPIGQWVLEQACRLLGEWEKAPRLASLRLAVNISPRQFQDRDFLPNLQRLVGERCSQPERLTLEVTESMLMADALETVRTLDSIRDAGMGIALDDFGTGYSSMAHLKRFPICELKVDRMFVRDIEENPEDAAIVSALVGLAHSLRLRVVAEGVEHATQLELMREYGCDVVQGFHFSEPLPIEVFLERYAL